MTDAPAPRRGPLEAGRLVLVAVQFLTRIPVPDPGFREDDLRRATAAFPLVGALVGGVGALVAAVLWPVVTPVVAVLLLTAAEIAVTGAFHEDGLADTFDGLWGGWTVQRRIEIMRDSRLGTYGATALLLALGLRVAALAGIALEQGLGGVVVATLCGHVLGRAAILVVVRLLPPADDGGSGARVADPLGAVGLAVAGATTALVLGVGLGTQAWVPVLVAGPVVAGAAATWRAKLGGVTGDTLGATEQLVHLATLVSVAALP